MTEPVTQPPSGRPPLLSTPAEFAAAAANLAAGRGPVAIDTERASGFRYGDRAFLLQIRRRGCGTLLIDPEGNRAAVRDAFAPVLNELSWVIHAAASDLPSLAMLGLHPAALFDTELAGRLAGFERVNLAAMTEEILGISLAKGHGAEDWSTRPLPDSWLDYAALDVEWLLELAEAMAELLDSSGKLDIAHQEFEHLRLTHLEPPAPTQWRTAKGMSTLKSSEQLAAGERLWRTRERLAQDSDSAVTRVLATKTMVDMAKRLPTTAAELKKVDGGERLRGKRPAFWLSEVAAARRSDRETWPRPERSASRVPSPKSWQSLDPESWDVLTELRADLTELSEAVDIPAENILRPAVLRAAVWHSLGDGTIHTAEQLRSFLAAEGAREWQIDATTPLIAARVF